MRDAYTITVTDPQGHQTVNYYSGDGELYRSEGATYPVAYAKNAAGQMAQLHTWRNEAGNSDITRWYYDPFTGAVTNKLYADGKGTAYTYLADGRIASRLWARGVTTAYGYIDTATGSIRTTEYNDETQSITNTFSLAGQLLSVLDGTGATTFGYDSKGRQTAETNALAIITRSYDAYGRYIRFTLTPWLTSYPSFCVNYGYDLFNRLDTVTAIIGTETNTFTYSYIPGTTLISGYTASTSSTPSTILTVSKTYEANRNLITAVTNTFVSSVPFVVSAFDYSNDSTGKRTARSDYYNGSTVANTFNFNARGETTNAVMNSNMYNYNFDDIGNRTTSSVNSVFTTYTANQLNQYTALRTNGIYRTISHDADGNLRYDGYWRYIWNAENRPVDIYHSLNQATNDDIRVQMKYDSRNRRVERRIIKFRMTAQDPMTPVVDGVWDAVETHKYIWDGWNIAAEVIIDHINPMTNITYYTWGLDLSGTLQGAGGVGGLLCETKTTPFSTNSYYALTDANGNITEYVDDAGVIAAHGEHSAFGETELSGSMKDEFTHWFSSKPLDPETGQVQYQLRPYSPTLGIFLPRDPTEERGGVRLNGFVGNDGVNKWDYLGLEDVNKYIEFYYKNLSGNNKKVTSSTKANDILIDYDDSDAGISKIVYGSSRYVNNKIGGNRPLCSVRMILEIHMNPKYQGKGSEFRNPSVASSFSYLPHIPNVGATGDFLEKTEYYDDNLAYVVREHERGHARGWLQLILEKGLAEKITKKLNWEIIIPLIAAGKDDEVSVLMERAEGEVMKAPNGKDYGELSAVHMAAADKATLNVFKQRGWKESKDEDRIKFTYSP